MCSFFRGRERESERKTGVREKERERTTEREKDIKNDRSLETNKDRKRGMVGERKIGILMCKNKEYKKAISFIWMF